MAKVLRTPTQKNICDWLSLKISTKFFDGKFPFLTFQYPEFYNDGMVLSCNIFCQGFSVIVEKLQHKRYNNIFFIKKLAHIKRDVIIPFEIIFESVNLIQMSKQKIIIIMLGNNLVLMKKVHFKTQSKKLYITRNEGFQFTVFDKKCTQENV